MALPLSPALSICDSLAGIDDLDAFLDSQPALSHFPTPPSNSVPSPVTPGCDFLDQSARLDYTFIAKSLLAYVDMSLPPAWLDIDLLHTMLQQAQLPLEVLAIAQNILALLEQDPSKFATLSAHQPSRCLTIIAALTLAVSYSSDFPRNFSWWSKHVCQGMWTATDIDKLAMKIYAALDWNLHRCIAAEAVESAVAKLSQEPKDGFPTSVMPVKATPILLRAPSVLSTG